MGDHSSGTALADRLARPTRMEREGAPVSCLTPIPIRSCSRRGLPCHPCRQGRGGLLPHPFTLTPGKPGAVCFLWRYPSGLRLPASPGGRYPPPCLRGARTFLQPPPPQRSGAPAVARPPDRRSGASTHAQKGRFHPTLRPKRRTAAITALGYGLFRSTSLKASAAPSGGNA